MNSALKAILARLDRVMFGHFYNHSHKMLAKEVVGECRTLLDIGCGSHSPTADFKDQLDHSVGIDRYEPAISASRAAGIHNDYQLMDALDIEKHFAPDAFDCVLAFDLIEHLSKEDGLRLITMMENIAKKKVIIYTPNGFLDQHEYDGNPFQLHRSGWEIAEMEALGYRIIGINGLKILRGERAHIRWRPTFLWRRISFLSQPIATKFPRLAKQILCIKEIN